MSLVRRVEHDISQHNDISDDDKISYMQSNLKGKLLSLFTVALEGVSEDEEAVRSFEQVMDMFLKLIPGIGSREVILDRIRSHLDSGISEIGVSDFIAEYLNLQRMLTRVTGEKVQDRDKITEIFRYLPDDYRKVLSQTDCRKRMVDFIMACNRIGEAERTIPSVRKKAKAIKRKRKSDASSKDKQAQKKKRPKLECIKCSGTHYVRDCPERHRSGCYVCGSKDHGWIFHRNEQPNEEEVSRRHQEDRRSSIESMHTDDDDWDVSRMIRSRNGERLLKTIIDVNGQDLECDIDTQSEVTMISRRCFDMLRNKRDVIASVRKSILADGSRVVDMEARRTTLLIDGTPVSSWIVDRDTGYNVLIGDDFLRRRNVIIEYMDGKKTVKIEPIERVSRRYQSIAASVDPTPPFHEGDSMAWNLIGNRDGFAKMMKRVKSLDTIGKHAVSTLALILTQFKDVFAESVLDLPGSTIVEPVVEVTGKPKFRMRGRTVNRRVEQLFKKQYAMMEKAGIVSKFSGAEFFTALHVVPKKAKDELRITNNLIPLNKLCSARSVHLLRPVELLDWLGSERDGLSNETRARHWTGYDSLRRSIDWKQLKRECSVGPKVRMRIVLDMKSGYFQIEIPERFRKFFAHMGPDGGLYVMNRLPQGWRNSSAYYQEAMDKMLCDLINCRAYQDDIHIKGDSHHVGEMLEELIFVLIQLRKWKLRLHVSKNSFFEEKTIALGFVAEEDGVRVARDIAEKVKEFPVPKSKKDIRSFLGLAGFFAHIVPYYGVYAAPLSNMTKKNVEFMVTDDFVHHFEKLKELLKREHVIGYINYDKPLNLYSDASKDAYAGVMTQVDDSGVERIVRCFHKKFHSSWKSRGIPEKECWAIWKTVKKYRHMIEGADVTVFVDADNLVKIAETGLSSNRSMERWMQDVMQYGVKFKHISGEDNTMADFLSRNFRNVNDEVNDNDVEDNPSEELSKLIREVESTCNEVKGLLKKEVQLSDATRSAKRIARRSKLQGDKLLYKSGRQWLLVPPSSSWREIMITNHIENHEGSPKLLAKIKRLWYWPKMTDMAELIVETCKDCKLAKGNADGGAVPIVPLHSFKVFDELFVDITQCSLTDRSFKYLLVIECAASRWCELCPLGSKDDIVVTGAIQSQWILRYGCPSIIRSDNGSEFTAEIMQKLNRAWGINHAFSSAYHPETQGRVERVNRTVKDWFRTHGYFENNNWDLACGQAMMFYNNSPHSALSGLSPYEVVFCKKMMTPILKNLVTTIDVVPEESEVRLVDRAILGKEMSSFMYENRKRLRRKRALDYCPYKVGDSVFIRNHMRRTNKLELSWTGPMKVTEVMVNSCKVEGRDAAVSWRDMKRTSKRRRRQGGRMAEESVETKDNDGDQHDDARDGTAATGHSDHTGGPNMMSHDVSHVQGESVG